MAAFRFARDERVARLVAADLGSGKVTMGQGSPSPKLGDGDSVRSLFRRINSLIGRIKSVFCRIGSVFGCDREFACNVPDLLGKSSLRKRQIGQKRKKSLLFSVFFQPRRPPQAGAGPVGGPYGRLISDV
jgi:hypothetical protein